MTLSTYQIGVLLAIASSFTATGIMLWGRELQHREGPWRYMLLITIGPALVGLLSWILYPPDWSYVLIESAFLVTIPVLLAKFLVGLALRFGHASHVAPAMGAKALTVTALAALLGFEPVTPNFWIAAAILFVGLLLVSGNTEVFTRPWRVLDLTMGVALLACIGYSFADLITRSRMAEHNLAVWDFVSVSWVCRGALVFLGCMAIKCFRKCRLMPARLSAFAITPIFICTHSLIIIGAFKYTNSAVLVNVLTNLRGIVSLLVVVALAHYNLTRDEELTRSMFTIRLLGSLLICFAVYLALQ